MWVIKTRRSLEGPSGLWLPEGDGGAGGVGEDGHPADSGDLLRADGDFGSEARRFSGGGVDVVDAYVSQPCGGHPGHGVEAATGAAVGLECAVDHALTHIVIGEGPVEELAVELLCFGGVGGGELEVDEGVCHGFSFQIGVLCRCVGPCCLLRSTSLLGKRGACVKCDGWSGGSRCLSNA